MPVSCYKIRYTYSAMDDIYGIQDYILTHFKYRQLIDNFKKKLLKTERSLTTFPDGYASTGFVYRGYTIFLKPDHTYLFFYVVNKPNTTVYILRVLQDGMNWKYIINRWLKEKHDYDE